MQSNQIEMVDAIIHRVYGVAPDHLPTDDGMEFLVSSQDLPELRKMFDTYVERVLPGRTSEVKLRFEP